MLKRPYKRLKGCSGHGKLAVESKSGSKFENDNVLIPWLVMHTGEILTRFKMGPDGRTPYFRLKGKHPRTKMIPFGEKVMYMPAKDTREKKNKLEPRFEDGIWVGIDAEASEAVILTPTGVKLARSVKRLPEDERYSATFLNTCKGAPWDPKGKEEEDRQEEEPSGSAEGKEPNTEREEEQQAPPPAPEQRFRRSGVRPKDIRKYGSTANCPGCRAIERGIGPRTHSEACRERIRKKMMEDDQDRKRAQQHQEREDRHISERMEEEEKEMRRGEHDEVRGDEEDKGEGGDGSRRDEGRRNDEQGEQEIKADESPQEEDEIRFGSDEEAREDEPANKKRRTEDERRGAPGSSSKRKGDEQEERESRRRRLQWMPDAYAGSTAYICEKNAGISSTSPRRTRKPTSRGTSAGSPIGTCATHISDIITLHLSLARLGATGQLTRRLNTCISSCTCIRVKHKETGISCMGADTGRNRGIIKI